MGKIEQPIHYNMLTLALDTVHADQKIAIHGDHIVVLSMDGIDASIKLNSRRADSIDLMLVKEINSPFERLFLTHTAQTGKTLKLAIGGEASFKVKPSTEQKSSPYSTIGYYTATSTNAYAVLATIWVAYLTRFLLVMRETGKTNGITFKVEGSIDGTNYKQLTLTGGKSEIDVSADGFEYEYCVEPWKYIRVSIKSTVADSHGDAELGIHGERM